MQKDETPRCLEDICEKENFQIKLQNNTYCSLATSKKIDCKYQSNKKDHNGLYPCIRRFEEPEEFKNIDYSKVTYN